MKKFMLSIVCFTMVLVGCSKKDSFEALLDSENPITITIWHYYTDFQETAFDELVSTFNETVGAEKGIIVEASNVGYVNELSEKVMDSIENKDETMPNIFAAYADIAYNFDQIGMIADLNPYFTKAELDEYVDNYIEEGNFNGLKIFPIVKSSECLQINQTEWEPFAQANDLTIEDLSTVEGITRVAELYYNYTDAQTPSENDGKAFFGRDALSNYVIIGCKQMGSELFEIKENQVTIHMDEEVFRRLYDNYHLPFISGYFSAKGRFRSDDVKKGNIIAFVGSSSATGFFPKEVYADDNTSKPIESLFAYAPDFEDGEKIAVQQGAGMAIMKNEPVYEYASSLFLKWFTDTEQNLQFSLKSAYLPVKKEAYNIEALNQVFERSDSNKATIEGLKMTIQQSEEYEFFTTKPFAHCEEARTLINDYMMQSAQTGRADAEARLAKGEKLADIKAEYASDEAFKTWYDGLKEQLEAVVYQK